MTIHYSAGAACRDKENKTIERTLCAKWLRVPPTEIVFTTSKTKATCRECKRKASMRQKSEARSARIREGKNPGQAKAWRVALKKLKKRKYSLPE